LKSIIGDIPELSSNLTERRHNFIESVSLLKSILRSEELEDPNSESAAGILRVVEAKLQDDKFYLAVLGQFKRGKSTFINAILNDDILPTGVVPLTSVVTTIHYAQKVSVEVTYKTGKQKTVTPKQLNEIVTERGNPGNCLGVSRVTIGHPSMFLKEGLILVDTPGVGSMQEANTAETLAYLPRIDAAIFLLSIDQPVNVAELDFINLSNSFSPKIYFVLNKIDLVREKELSESLAYCRKTLAGHLSEILLYPVSSRWHLEGHIGQSGIPALVVDLQESLWKKRDSVGLQGNILRLKRCLEILKEKNNLEKKAVMASQQQLSESIERLKNLEGQVKQVKEDFRYILRGESERVLRDLGEKVESHRQIKSYELTREILNRYSDHRTAIKKIENYAFQRLFEELELWRPEFTILYELKTKQLLQRFVAQAKTLASDVIRAGGDVLGVSVSSQLQEAQWSEESTLEYFIEKEVGLIPFRLENVLAPLPWLISKTLILIIINKRVGTLFDRNCGRIREDIAERLNITTREYFKKWEAELDRIVTAIADALQKGIRLQNDQVSKITWKKEMSKREDVIRDIEERLPRLSV